MPRRAIGRALEKYRSNIIAHEFDHCTLIGDHLDSSKPLIQYSANVLLLQPLTSAFDLSLGRIQIL